MQRPRVTIQLCTYNRAALLGRVLRGCFEQSVSDYEVVLVNDGSSDATEAVIDEARQRATVRFRTVTHSNRGLARSRNVGIEMARGERIIFIDDDVLPMPNFVEEHLRTAARHPRDIVRGAVILTESFERLPAPFWSLRHYSGNFFWTSNVSVPVETLRRVGAFNETFREYGWEDIEVGLRLRKIGVRSRLNTRAIAFHYKAPLRARNVAGMIAQARSQARTAVELARLHPHWRVPLATGDEPLQRAMHRGVRALHRSGVLQRVQQMVGQAYYTTEWFSSLPPEQLLSASEVRAARSLAQLAYFQELDLAHALAEGA